MALIGVPAFVVTLAGYQIWQGVIQKSIPQGVLVIQDNTVNNIANYFFSKAGRLDHRVRRGGDLRRQHAERRALAPPPRRRRP